MPVMDHLNELRSRLFISIAALGLAAIVVFFFYSHILTWLQHPYCEAVKHREANSCNFLVTSPLDPFAIRLQVATYGGFILASPVIFWQLWRFVTPGLKATERKYAIPFVVASILLFAFGGFIAYLTFPKALGFLVQIGGPSLDVRLDPTKYLGLILLMIIAFGVSFEFPVFLVFLELIGVLSSERLRKWRRPALVAIVIFAAVITPSQDPYSLFAMAVPMYIFYEASILIGRFLKK